MAESPFHDLVVRFVAEAQRLTQTATRSLLALERAEDDAQITAHRDVIARALHTLKGTSATLGLQDEAKVYHRLEEMFGTDEQKPSATAVDVILRALAASFERIRVQAQAPHLPPPPLDDVLRLVEANLAQSPADELPAPDTHEDGGEATPDIATPMATMAGEWTVDALEVRTLIRDVERLREVRLRLEARAANVGDPRLLARRLADEALELGSVIESIEERVETFMTLSFHVALEPLELAVREVCRRTGKMAQLAVVGPELKLDRNLLNDLVGALVHVARNAVDHGIEMPDARKRAGKDPIGSVVLRVEWLGNLLRIEVEDDGAGIDLDRVRKRALELGFVTPEQAALLTEDTLGRFIFKRGLTTRDSITETSGRGVGLDAVADRVRALRGHTELKTRKGQGTRLTIVVPTSLGSFPVVVVRAANQSFGIPVRAVESLLALDPKQCQIGPAQMHVNHRDAVLPLFGLAAALGLRPHSVPPPRTPVLVVSTMGTRVAVSVDEVRGERGAAVLGLPQGLGGEAYEGAFLEPDGSLLLVLRPDWLVRQIGAQRAILGTRRILVVDDSISARSLHRAILEAAGFTVHAVESSGVALALLSENAYDAVVTDIHMPDHDGLWLTAQIRADARLRKLPVFVLSADDTEENRLHVRQVGGTAFLAKADSRSGRLVETIREAIGSAA